jgi:alpha-beta hydrolase superfamily lysophospholipase
MIAMAAMRSTSLLSRRLALLASLAVAGCASATALSGPVIMPPSLADDAFIMPDGARLPYRVWLPEGPPKAMLLALHGFNDSRNAWTFAAPAFAAAGIAVYAPDQRGFGAAPGRGLWPGGDTLVDDADAMTRLLRARNPSLKLFVIGESMGGAVAMRLATERRPPVAGYILSAPAVWGRARMNFAMESGLWLMATIMPGLTVSRSPVPVTPSDNRDALIRLSRDPLTVRETRFDSLRGLVDLMDAALAAAPHFTAPGLFLYGGHDDLVPPRATAAIWESLPASAIRAFYPNGYHLLSSDLGRAAPIGDVIAWITEGHAPTGAENAASLWLASQG